MLRDYYHLTKPGIVYGNVFTTLAGFLFASRWQFGWGLFFAAIFGIAFVIASACVFNNYLDRDIDIKMERTKDRALVSGAISNTSALAFASALGLIGLVILFFFANILTAFIALVGFLVYVFAYTFSKRWTHFATEIGSIAGAVPIVVGYTAVTNQFDGAALILFLILALWQMPHFYSIAIYRLDEYAAAGIPTLPIRKGIATTKIYILCYILAFGIAAALLAVFGYAGYAYLTLIGIASLAWFLRAVQGFKTKDDAAWARKLFFFSLITLVLFSAILSVAAIVP